MLFIDDIKKGAMLFLQRSFRSRGLLGTIAVRTRVTRKRKRVEETFAFVLWCNLGGKKQKTNRTTNYATKHTAVKFRGGTTGKRGLDNK